MERSGRTVHLEPRVMRLLVRLHHAHGEVLTRDRLFESVWDGRFVSENSLTNAVSELRRALGDQAGQIETIPKVGYRLRATSPMPGPERLWRQIRWGAVASALALTSLLGLGAWWFAREPAFAPQDGYVASLSLPRRGPPNREAIRLLRASLHEQPDQAGIWAELSRRLYLEAHDNLDPRVFLDEAEHSARVAVALDPAEVRALRQLVILNTESGDLGSALNVAGSLLEVAPERADSHFALAYVLRYAGLLEAAATECRIAFRLGGLTPALRSCAVPLYRSGSFEQARQFVDLDHGSQWALHQEALIRIYEGRLEDAARAFRRLPAESPFNGLLESCRRPGAGASLERVRELALKIDDPEAKHEVALLMVVCRRPDGALSLLGQAADDGHCLPTVPEVEAPFRALLHHDGWEQTEARIRHCRRRLSAPTHAVSS